MGGPLRSRKEVGLNDNKPKKQLLVAGIILVVLYYLWFYLVMFFALIGAFKLFGEYHRKK